MPFLHRNNTLTFKENYYFKKTSKQKKRNKLKQQNKQFSPGKSKALYVLYAMLTE